MPNEIELKLRIASADISRLRRHPAIKQHLAGKSITRRLVSTYFDTPDLKLLDSAVSLRVRRMSGAWFQAVKDSGHTLAGLHQRMEAESPVATSEPDFTKITEPTLAGIFAKQNLRDALQPVFITDVQRTEWQLEYADGSAVEVALDIGKLQAGKKTESIQEVELELKRGKTRHLFELALALQADIPLDIENVSKAQRGYAYYRPPLLTVSKAKTIELKPKMSALKAFQQIAWECLRQLQSNQNMVLNGDDPEGAHQMRIGLRRLLVAIKLFKCETKNIQKDLDWLATLLGNARDWDVLLHTTWPDALNNLTPHPGFILLQQLATAAHKQAYKKLRQGLHSQRYQRLLLNLGVWLISLKHLPHTKIHKLADRRLLQSHNKLQQFGENIVQLKPKRLHQLRIEAKYLRYAAEFFVRIYSAGNKPNKGPKIGQLINRLVRLQGALGLLNDINVTKALIGQLANSQIDSQISEAANLILEWNALRAQKPLKELQKIWQNYASTGFLEPATMH